MKNIVTVLLLLGILCIAFLLGSRMILAGDFFYLADQARDMLLTQDIVVNRNIVLIGTHSGIGGFFHGPLWLYMLIPFYFLGNGNPLFFTFMYICISLVTVVVAFYVGKRLYGLPFAVIVALLTAVSPVVWSYVPNTIGVNMIPLLFFLFFLFLIEYMRGNKYSFIYVSFFAGLMLQFETALPLILIPMLFILFFLQPTNIRSFKLIAMSIGAYVLSVLTFIIFDIRHQFLMTKSLLQTFSSGEKLSGYMNFPERTGEHIQSLINVYKASFFTQSNILFILMSCIIVIYIFLNLKKKQKYNKEFFLFVFFPIIIYVFYLFYAYPIHPEYVLGLSVPILLGFSLAIVNVHKYTIGKFLNILFLGITVIMVFQSIYSQYFITYVPNHTAGSYKNQQKIVEWIYKDAKKNKFSYFVYSPNTFTYGMDYLFWWYGTQQNGYIPIPQEGKKYITYLILYPTSTNSHIAHEFWKKHVIRTKAKFIKRKEFSGGIIVEKINPRTDEAPVDTNYFQNLIFR